MDEADVASGYTEMFLNAAIQTHWNAVGRTRTESAENCDICSDPIPEARRLAVPGCLLCVDCQSDQERNC